MIQILTEIFNRNQDFSVEVILDPTNRIHTYHQIIPKRETILSSTHVERVWIESK